MLKTLWVIDALLLLSSLGMALITRGIDPAGRSVLWVLPLAIGAALAGSFYANRSGAIPLAIGLAMIGPAVAAGIFLTIGRSTLKVMSENSGAAYFNDPAIKKIVSAIAANDTAAIEAAKAAGVDFNTVGRQGMTLLDFTITHNPNMVGALIKAGADPNRVVPNRITALAQALDAPGAAFEQLVQGGADPNGPGENEGSSIIFSTIQSGQQSRYELLVAKGANIADLDSYGQTTMMAAASQSQWKIALDLLNRGVDPAVVGKTGRSVSSIVEGAANSNSDNADYQAFVAALSAKLKK